MRSSRTGELAVRSNKSVAGIGGFMTRRSFIQGVVIIMCSGLILGACGLGSPDSADSPDDALQKVEILTGGHVLPWAPLYVAINEGYFKEEGLQPNLTETVGGTIGVSAASGRSALLTFIGLPTVIPAIAAGAPLRIVMVTGAALTSEIIVSNELLERTGVSPEAPIEERVAALKDARYGVWGLNDAIHQLVQYLFKKYSNLDPAKDIKVIPVNDAAGQLAAMKRGDIDAFGVSPPTGGKAEQEGLGKIFIRGPEIPDLDGFPFLVGVAHIRDLEDNRPALVASIKAISRALNDLREQPAEFKDTVRKSFKETPDDVFNFTYNSMISILPTSTVPSEDAYAIYGDWVNTLGKLAPPSYADAVDPGPAQKAEAG